MKALKEFDATIEKDTEKMLESLNESFSANPSDVFGNEDPSSPYFGKCDWFALGALHLTSAESRGSKCRNPCGIGCGVVILLHERARAWARLTIAFCLADNGHVTTRFFPVSFAAYTASYTRLYNS